ncbi:MAG: TP53 regulating kinase [Paramarteilia canceri]
MDACCSYTSEENSALDASIRKKRTKKEAKNIKSLSNSDIRVPEIIDVSSKDCIIYLEYFEKAILVKDFLKSSDISKLNAVKDLFKKIGILIAKLHKFPMCHGDLTGSNILILNRDGISDKYD